MRLEVQSDLALRIAALRERYQAPFERELNAATSVRNYEYLDLLDSAWTERALTPLDGGTLCDVGCASFWYAAALQAFFRPQRLIGVEVEGYRRLRDGRSRIDHARGYLERIPGARFEVADYADFAQPADLITAWFPFVSAPAILAWRLPLRLLAPQRLLQRIHDNLRPEGRFIMVNHGSAEADLAAEICAAVGLVRETEWSGRGVFGGHRLQPPVLSVWWRR